jgi:hypothetical protein
VYLGFGAGLSGFGCLLRPVFDEQQIELRLA